VRQVIWVAKHKKTLGNYHVQSKVWISITNLVNDQYKISATSFFFSHAHKLHIYSVHIIHMYDTDGQRMPRDLFFR